MTLGQVRDGDGRRSTVCTYSKVDAAAGHLLADQGGGVRMAASSDKAQLLELFAADPRGRVVREMRTLPHSNSRLNEPLPRA